MRYERELQVQLRERYRRLYKTDAQGHYTQSGYIRDFILKSPALRAIVEHVERSEPDLDPTEWMKAKFANRSYEWPANEQAKAKVAWHLMKDLASEDGVFTYQTLGHNLTYLTSPDEVARTVTEQVFEPFIEYLEDKLGSESMTLYHLERLKQRIERFDRHEQYTAYLADTRRGEDTYDRYMQRFLFDQGVEVISKARTASGEADLVADIDTDDALVAELKLYDGSSYGVGYLRKGFNQAVQYAHDYNKTAAHLVVVNLSDNNLQFESDENSIMWPPRLHASGVTVYIVAIRALPMRSASSLGNQKTVPITRGNLVLDTPSDESS